MDVLLFTVDGRRIAIPLRQVAEVLLAVNVMSLYDAPSIIEGVVNVRGAVLPVLALRARMGHPPREVRASDYFIIVRTSERPVILQSDTTPEIVALDVALDDGRQDLQRTLAGVLPLPDGLALFKDIDAFMASGEDDALRDALAGAPSPA